MHGLITVHDVDTKIVRIFNTYGPACVCTMPVVPDSFAEALTGKRTCRKIFCRGKHDDRNFELVDAKSEYV